MSGIHTQAWIHEFLELVDSVMKHVVFELAANGYRLVTYCGEDFLVEADDSSRCAVEHVASVARRATASLVPDVPVPCLCQAVAGW
jgi:hypothetical protein